MNSSTTRIMAQWGKTEKANPWQVFLVTYVPLAEAVDDFAAYAGAALLDQGRTITEVGRIRDVWIERYERNAFGAGGHWWRQTIPKKALFVAYWRCLHGELDDG